MLLVACDNTNLRSPSEVESGWSSNNTQHPYSSQTGMSNYIPFSSVSILSSGSTGMSSSSASGATTYFSATDFVVTPMSDTFGSISTYITSTISGVLTLEVNLSLATNVTSGATLFAGARIAPRNSHCVTNSLELYSKNSGMIPTKRYYSSDASITDGVVEFYLVSPNQYTTIQITGGYCSLK